MEPQLFGVLLLTAHHCRCRGFPLESIVARICREAGGRVTTNVLVRDLDIRGSDCGRWSETGGSRKWVASLRRRAAGCGHHHRQHPPRGRRATSQPPWTEWPCTQRDSGRNGGTQHWLGALVARSVVLAVEVCGWRSHSSVLCPRESTFQTFLAAPKGWNKLASQMGLLVFLQCDFRHAACIHGQTARNFDDVTGSLSSCVSKEKKKTR